MKAVTKNNHEKQVNWIRFLYCGFVLLSIYYLLIARDLNSFVINFGIALAFDPFDQKLIWNKRPLWQKTWLIVHLGLVLAGFIYMLTLGDKM